MSQQGLQRTQQLLQVIGAQLPSIAQASAMLTASNLRVFVYGTLQRSGVEITQALPPVVNALVELIEPIADPMQPQPEPDICLPLDDAVAQS